MFAIQEDVHDSPNKGKPRLSRSQLNSGTVISSITIKEYKRAAKTLAKSFDKDPFVNYILNTEIEPLTLLRKQVKLDLFLSFFEYSVYDVISSNGLVLVVKDVQLEDDLISNQLKSSEINKLPFLAVACFNLIDSNERMDDSLSFHPSSIKFNLFASLTKCRLKVFKDKFPLLNSIRDGVLTNLKLNRIWYLNDIGVLPHAQGNGYAKKLIQFTLDHYIKQDYCYLESSNIINRKFYEKLGFKIMKSFFIDDGEIIMDAMVNTA